MVPELILPSCSLIDVEESGEHGSGERVNESDARWSVMSTIAGHYDQTENECCGGKLLIERILRVGYSQTPPDLCGLLIEWQDRVGVVAQNSV